MRLVWETSRSTALLNRSGLSSLSVGDELTVGKVLGAGAFGTVHTCTVDGWATPCVLKLFDQGASQGDVHLDVIRDLHAALDPLLSPAGTQGAGIPLWAGYVQGVRGAVAATLALDLAALGMTSLEEVLEGRHSELAGMPLVRRLALARSVAEEAALLDAAGFVHGDLNAENLFVDLRNCRATLIDHDAGAVLATGRPPLAAGKCDEFSAPELTKAAAAPLAKLVTLESDRWATAFLVSYLLLGQHPLFFLRNLGSRTVSDYASRWTWPDVSPGDPVVSAHGRQVLGRWQSEVAQLPDAVTSAFATLIATGVSAPSSRPTAMDWSLALSDVPPVVESFLLTPAVAVCGATVEISWSVRNATAVSLVGQHGLPATGRLTVVACGSGTITLWATNLCGSTLGVSAPLVVLVPPADPPAFLVPRPPGLRAAPVLRVPVPRHIVVGHP